MNENIEIELRGKIIALSLTVEDSITKIVHNFLYPKSKDKETLMIYFKEIIIPLQLNKKKDILKHILKTERYKKLCIPVLNEKKILGESNQFESYEKYCSYIINSINEIIKDRNIIAHGHDLSLGFPATTENGDIVLANKTKIYKYSKKEINMFIERTEEINYFLKLIHLGV